LTDQEVHIADYDPAWPSRFEAERELLQQAIGGWVVDGIHHIGSTSVPRLAAKPVIDIMAGDADLESSRPCIEALGALQYLYAPYRADVEHWFCKPDPSYRTHHLHLVPTGSPRYRDALVLRDFLRTHYDVAAQYGELKRSLATRFRADRDAYTDAKAEFVTAVLARAG